MWKVQFFTRSYSPNRWMNLDGSESTTKEQAWKKFAECVFDYSDYTFRVVDEHDNVITD